MTVDAAGKKKPHMPLIVEEWSNNIWQRDLCNDTCYKSAYLFKNILEQPGLKRHGLLCPQ